MAYRNFSQEADMALHFAAPQFSAAQPESVSVSESVSEPTDVAAFTDLELSVVDIARRDPLSSIHAPGRIARRMDKLFGNRRTLPLADPRLEALRRFVVADHYLGARLPDHEVALFVGAGFTRAHVRLLRSSPLIR